MGVFFSWLRKQDETWNPDIPIQLNLSDTPKPSCQSSQALVKVLQGDLLKTLSNYTGCTNEIKNAISKPSPENDQLAYKALSPAVDKINLMFSTCGQLEEALTEFFSYFCDSSKESLTLAEQDPGSVFLFAEVLYFIHQLDELKMGNPNLQNDFSYYRRSLTKIRQSQLTGVTILPDELTNRISLFLAQAAPFTKACLDHFMKLIEKRKMSDKNVLDLLVAIIAVTYDAVSKQKVENVLKYLKMMTTACVFYDHLDPKGFFVNSKIHAKSVLQLIKSHPSAECQNLLNAFKYSTVHYNDENVPKAIRELLNS